ncbi:MAG: hypothetical protein RLZ45_1805 [Verrucomicrobiota bacterium]
MSLLPIDDLSLYPLPESTTKTKGRKTRHGDNRDGHLDQGMARYFIGTSTNDLTPDPMTCLQTIDDLSLTKDLCR